MYLKDGCVFFTPHIQGVLASLQSYLSHGICQNWSFYQTKALHLEKLLLCPSLLFPQPQRRRIPTPGFYFFQVHFPELVWNLPFHAWLISLNAMSHTVSHVARNEISFPTWKNNNKKTNALQIITSLDKYQGDPRNNR